ncbi:hypothetical protein [Schleiferilactobacillus perolens]|uniref:Uncharacterized protein n=1 Tax=Schleiferilactobacillus perolens DSM 12744 TaxID=1423792 RepID=A0A0R1N374_9LACO|nr:hypothetical protein [Schleiferilactobacillus perolens]KRL14654.1 hypothetical protein FD09_GL000308 [Schleiferilactobacillus perolens DSM 12744]
MFSETLTQSQRDAIMTAMTAEQLEVLHQQKLGRMKSLFFNSLYQDGEHFEFVDMIDDPGRKLKLRCECGRPLRYQYILKDTETGRILKLGSTHFAQHTNIAPSLIREINKGVKRINLTLDEILIPFSHGVRFPTEDYLEAQDYIESPNLKRIESFRHADLPPYAQDMDAIYDGLMRLRAEEEEAARRERIAQQGNNVSSNHNKKLWAPRFGKIRGTTGIENGVQFFDLSDAQEDDESDDASGLNFAQKWLEEQRQARNTHIIDHQLSVEERKQQLLEQAKQDLSEAFDGQIPEYISSDDVDYLVIMYFIAYRGHNQPLYFKPVAQFVQNMERKYSLDVNTESGLIEEKSNRLVAALMQKGTLKVQRIGPDKCYLYQPRST